jgi:dolichol-phosphate mannosyltransferase
MTSDFPPPGSLPFLSVVIPTYNERAGIVALVRAVLDVLGRTACEVIVVDDGSPDGTADVVTELSASEPRVRLLSRSGKQGLASAVFAGAAEARGTFVCVMDGDFSHDPEEIPGMLTKAQEGYDVVIGSRFVPGAANVGQPLPRRIASGFLNGGARLALLLKPRDVLTGYVLCSTESLQAMPTHYSAEGFKWLVELLATGPELRVFEWPIVFHDRREGESKAGFGEIAIFAVLVGRLFAWRARRLRGRVLR